MAKTTLRAYSRDIETMLDSGQLDEAVAHCHHILKTFPKHLATYRLLGKTFLEMKKHGDAVDIFSRVLACAPNDFVANVGMSLIRDDENKLEDALVHMERAFETQPSNAAVQSELQRLYVRRDGSAPSRIRMTRGALAHMYVKGELYPQAISEIKGVLKEDPGRTDMEVLQARVYYRSGQKKEAVEVASSLLRRYPYCLDANAVLVDILGAEKPESVQENRQRVIELDPYAAHVSGSLLDSSGASDSAVSIEKLDWKGESVSMPSDWRETRGISLQAPAREEPEWLKKSLEQTETTPPSAGEAAFRMDASAQPEEDLPEFLREAGWGKSTGAFDESKVSMMDAAETVPPTAAVPIAAADMPDWIKAMAPDESQKPASDEPMPDWMDRIDPSVLPSSEAASATEEPDWLKELGGTPAESQSPTAAFSDQPDWLKDLGGSAETPAQQPATASGDQPDWLKDLGGSTETPAQQPGAASSDQPDWLKGFADESESTVLAEAGDDLDFLKQGADQPEESKSVAASSAPTMDASSNLGAQSEEDAFAWLESLAVKQGSTEGLLLKPEERPAEEPDWVKQAKSLSGEAEIPTAPPVSEPVEEPAATLGDLEELGKSGQEQDDSFAWLESLAVKQGSTEGLLVKPEERKESEPDWVKQAKEIGEALPPVSQQETGQPESSADTAAWLKSLDAETPASEPMQEATSDETAAWLKSLETETPISEPAQASASDETAMWLKSLDEPEKSAVVEPALSGELPDWMQNLEAEKAASEAESAVPVVSNESKEVEEAEAPSSAWIDETVVEEPRRYDTGNLPNWLQDMDSGVPSAASRDALPAWLRDETGEAVAEPAKIEPTRAEEWQPVETQEPAAFEAPPETPKPEKPKVEPKPKKAAPPKKSEPRPVTPIATYQEPVTRKGTGMLTQTVDIVLGQARNELNRSNIPGALETYTKLIKKGRYLDEIIFDLREASYRYPVEVSIWQALGDAYMRGNRLQDALDAYTKAEELLR
ncbi:MAG: tetratricopeptide repeat protein [Anaerolineales bacterium]|nr:tetratricopeptide repeat protein [Anaerolineales bacterium]